MFNRSEIFLAQTLYLVFLLTSQNLSHIHKLQIPKKDTPCHSTYIPLFGLTPLWNPNTSKVVILLLKTPSILTWWMNVPRSELQFIAFSVLTSDPVSFNFKYCSECVLRNENTVIEFCKEKRWKCGKHRERKKQMMKRAVRWIYLLHYHLEWGHCPLKRLQFGRILLQKNIPYLFWINITLHPMAIKLLEMRVPYFYDTAVYIKQQGNKRWRFQ